MQFPQLQAVGELIPRTSQQQQLPRIDLRRRRGRTYLSVLLCVELEREREREERNGVSRPSGQTKTKHAESAKVNINIYIYICSVCVCMRGCMECRVPLVLRIENLYSPNRSFAGCILIIMIIIIIVICEHRSAVSSSPRHMQHTWAHLCTHTYAHHTHI